MKDKINSIDMNGTLDHEEVYNLFKTHSSKINKEISEKIDNFKLYIDFFEFYSNKDIKNLLNIFELNLSKNNDELFSNFKSDTEQYISCISQIILSIKLFLKTHDILTNTVINAKNHLSKLKYKDKFENHNTDYLLLYFGSLLKISEKNLKIYSNSSTLLNNNISTFENTTKNLLFPKYFNQYEIDGFSKGEIEPAVYDNPPTPKFQLKSNKKFEIQEKSNSTLKNSIKNNSPMQKDSILTLSKYVFVEESTNQEDCESKLIETSIIKPKKIIITIIIIM